MDAHHLEAFVAIIDSGSFTRAAARLGITQPTVTNRIKTLEHALGTPLLERLPGGVRPTGAGRELLPYAREIIGLTARAQQAVRTRSEPHGRIDVGSSESVTSHRLLPLIEYLYIRYPQVQVSLHAANQSGDPVAAVRDGQFDCAFLIDHRRTDDDLNVQVLCPEPLALVVGREHPLLSRDPITALDLEAATLVRCDVQAPYHARFDAAVGRAAPHSRRRVFELDSIDATKRSVANGMGMALLPEVAVVAELADRSLQRLAWNLPFETYTQVIWRRNRARHPALAAVVDAAAKVIAEQLAAE